MNKQKQSVNVYNAKGIEFNIYPITKTTKAGPKEYWILVDYSTGKRRLLNNKTKKAAQDRADTIRAAMVKGQASRMSLSNGEWQGVCLAREKLRSLCTGDSLLSAITEWGDAKAMLGDRASLLDAIKFYLTHHKDGGPPLQPTRFGEAGTKFHSFMVKAGLSSSHTKNTKCRLNILERKLPADAKLHELTAGQLDAVVVGLGFGPKTMNEYRLTLSSLFAWAQKQNPPMVRKGFNPARDMTRHRVKHEDVKFLTAAELRTILLTAPAKRPDIVPLIVLVCFGALRPSEAVRLDWSEVGESHIRLPGTKSKTGYSRQIPLSENLKAWLNQWRKPNGPVCPGIDLSHLNHAIHRFSGISMPHDGMRHGYGTHRHQILKNIAAVADEMGNSAQICRGHYLNAFCTEAEAAAWFNISPAAATNIIPLATVSVSPPGIMDGGAAV